VTDASGRVPVSSGDPFQTKRPPASIGRWLFGVIVLAGCFLWLLPVIVAIMTALEPDLDVVSNGMTLVPAHITWSNFSSAWELGDLGSYMKNSLIITAVSVPLGIIIAALLAFPLATRQFFGRRAIMVLLLLGIGISPLVALYPLSALMRGIGIAGSLWALLPPYVAFGLPFQSLVLRGAFLGVPKDLLEAARLDGAREIWVWSRVAMPLVIPVLGALALVTAVATWNEFVMALILINRQSARTLPLGLSNFEGAFQTNIAQLTAGAVIALVPMVALFVLLRRHMVRGMAAGAIKF
jgi:raffinose/stachyose/melibiose transport system permease protein